MCAGNEIAQVINKTSQTMAPTNKDNSKKSAPTPKTKQKGCNLQNMAKNDHTVWMREHT